MVGLWLLTLKNEINWCGSCSFRRCRKYLLLMIRFFQMFPSCKSDSKLPVKAPKLQSKGFHSFLSIFSLHTVHPRHSAACPCELLDLVITQTLSGSHRGGGDAADLHPDPVFITASPDTLIVPPKRFSLNDLTHSHLFLWLNYRWSKRIKSYLQKKKLNHDGDDFSHHQSTISISEEH